MRMRERIDVHAADPLASELEPKSLRARVHKEAVGLHVSPKQLRLSHHVVPLVRLLVFLIVKIRVRFLELVHYYRRRLEDFMSTMVALGSTLVALRTILARVHTHRTKVVLSECVLGAFGLG